MKFTQTKPEVGNWPKKSNALALEIVSQKCNALVIMHYFFKKSNALVKIIALEL